MRVVFAGGGTGGHLYPAIAIADALRDRADVTFIGTADRLEASIVPNAGYPLTTIAAKPLSRKHVPAAAATIAANTAGVAQSLRALARLKPDIVIATGGYVCFPVVVAARARSLGRRVPIALLEPNAHPGLTNRLLAPMVDEVWGAYADGDPRFGKKYVRTGVPVRASLRALPPRAEAAARLGVDARLRTLLAMGGSQGARAINDAIVDSAARAALPEGWQVLALTGSADAERIRAALAATPEARRVHVAAYLADPADAFAVADAAVARAGASTLAELAATGLPAILVPYPHATEDHQAANARAVARSGAAVVVRDDELGASFASTLERIAKPAQLEAMRMAARGQAPADAVDAICARIEALLARKGAV